MIRAHYLFPLVGFAVLWLLFGVALKMISSSWHSVFRSFSRHIRGQSRKCYHKRSRIHFFRKRVLLLLQLMNSFPLGLLWQKILDGQMNAIHLGQLCLAFWWMLGGPTTLDPQLWILGWSSFVVERKKKSRRFSSRFWTNFLSGFPSRFLCKFLSRDLSIFPSRFLSRPDKIPG